MRESLKQKIIQVCRQKIAQKGRRSGSLFMRFSPTEMMTPTC